MIQIWGNIFREHLISALLCASATLKWQSIKARWLLLASIIRNWIAYFSFLSQRWWWCWKHDSSLSVNQFQGSNSLPNAVQCYDCCLYGAFKEVLSREFYQLGNCILWFALGCIMYSQITSVKTLVLWNMHFAAQFCKTQSVLKGGEFFRNVHWLCSALIIIIIINN